MSFGGRGQRRPRIIMKLRFENQIETKCLNRNMKLSIKRHNQNRHLLKTSCTLKKLNKKTHPKTTTTNTQTSVHSSGAV